MASSSLHVTLILSFVPLFMYWHTCNSNLRSPLICGFCPSPRGCLPFCLIISDSMLLFAWSWFLAAQPSADRAKLRVPISVGDLCLLTHLPCPNSWLLLKHECPDSLFSPGLLCLCFCPGNPLTSLGSLLIECTCYNLLQDFSFLNQKEFSEYLLTDQSVILIYLLINRSNLSIIFLSSIISTYLSNLSSIYISLTSSHSSIHPFIYPSIYLIYVSIYVSVYL